MPHGHCYLWKGPLLWTHLLSDLLIGFAYVSISISLYVLWRRIRMPFSTMILSFGAFIGACGGTHFLEAWNLWNADYWWSAGVKSITAAASVATGAWLVKLRPQIYTVAQAAKLAERRRLDLEALTVDLERRVEDRTAALAKTEELFRATFENASVGIAHLTEEGAWIRVNRKYSEILGYAAEELRSLTFQAVTHPDDIERDAEQSRKLWSGEIHSYGMDKRYIRKDGSITWVHVNVSVVRKPDGKPDHFIATAQDINDQKAAEEALHQALKARDEFLSIASHELKTPLTTLKLQTQLRKRLLARGELGTFSPDSLPALIETDERQFNRLVRLVDEMLDVSRINSGRLQIELETLDLSALVQESVERFRPQLLVAACQVVPEIEKGITATLDRFRIEQVVANLLTNAMKYGAGQPVEISLKRRGPAQAVLRVRDQGIGIAPEDQERIFQPFERAVRATDISGMGLGLFISKQILELHGASIRVESAEGRGSSFIVELPLNPPIPA